MRQRRWDVVQYGGTCEPRQLLSRGWSSWNRCGEFNRPDVPNGGFYVAKIVPNKASAIPATAAAKVRSQMAILYLLNISVLALVGDFVGVREES